MTSQAYERVTVALQAKGSRKGSANNWTCPAHDDQTPSLSVREGEDGVLIKCHTGCKTEDVVKALGLTMADLFDRPFGPEPFDELRVSSRVEKLTAEGLRVNSGRNLRGRVIPNPALRRVRDL